LTAGNQGDPRGPGGQEDAVLRADGLTVAYGTADNVKVQSLTIDVRPYETVALVGESGSGKTTTALAMLGLLPRGGKVTEGTVFFRQEPYVSARFNRAAGLRGRHIGYIPQDPFVSLDPVIRIGEQIAEAIEPRRGRRRRNLEPQVLDLLSSVGIDKPRVRARQYPHELSGGMRQRVLCAIAVAHDPPVIIADEPTSHLDVTIQKQILDLIAALQATRGLAVLLITHDLAIARERARRVAVMQSGQLVETGTGGEVLGTPKSDYARRLIAASQLQTRRTPATPLASETSPVLSGRELTKVFRLRGEPGELRAVDGISIDVYQGRTVALVGESGSGKTTLSRMLCGLEKPTSGEIRTGGSAAESRSGPAVQYVYQNPYTSMNPVLRLRDIVTEPLRAHGRLSRRDTRSEARRLLDLVGLDQLTDLNVRPGQLSGGQRQRVAIARALSVHPSVLVLDEPVSALDAASRREVLDLLVRLQESTGLGYVMVTHDLAVARATSDYLYVMSKGRIVEEGPTSEVMSQPREPYTGELLRAVPKMTELRKEIVDERR
jgi:peptide/nickel transport system ATP-binding protein